jgi:hypothetical protein
MEPGITTNPEVSPLPLSRASRAHYRLSWAERLARNAQTPTASRPTITLFGVSGAFAAFLGLPSSLRCEAHEWRVPAAFPSPSGTFAFFTRSKSAWTGLAQFALVPAWVSSRCHAECRFCQRKAKLTGHPLCGSERGRLSSQASSMRLSCMSCSSQPHPLAAWTCSLNRCT